MGNYNPYAPTILGQEWVGIRRGDWVPDIFRESGYTFTLDSSHVVTFGRFYTSSQDLVELASFNPAFLINVYPTGLEAATGPIGKVEIPVQSGTLSGSAVMTGTSVQQCLENPSDEQGAVDLTGGQVDLRFNTTPYAQLLQGKRLLRVNFRMALETTGTPATPGISAALSTAGGLWFSLLPSPDTLPAAGFPEMFTISAGEISAFWNASTTYSAELHPWRYSEIARFSSSGGSPGIMLSISSSGASISYCAMEIYYCEETRVLAGAKETLFNGTQFGLNTIFLRNNSLNYPNTLTAGEYTITLSLADYEASVAG